MPIARKHQVDESLPSCFHCISRCVRRAYLCGDAAEHRRDWVRDRIRAAAASFAVDVLAYAVMSNHLHIVVSTEPGRVTAWTAREVAERWAIAHPRTGADGAPVPWSDAAITAKANNGAWVAKARLRLRSLSWFMKSIKEGLARRANRDDGCTGHFWEGRFRSVPLLDQAAVIACMAYVDLNPIRAACADRPETSAFTSVQDRMLARRAHQRDRVLGATAAPSTVPSLTSSSAITLVPLLHEQGPAARDAGPETGLWIAPIAAATIRLGNTPVITLDEYVTLVDETGRVVRGGKRGGKRGAIPHQLAPILERLHLDLAAWLELMHHGGAFHGSAFGNVAARTREAVRRGARWIVDVTCGLYGTAQHAA